MAFSSFRKDKPADAAPAPTPLVASLVNPVDGSELLLVSAGKFLRGSLQGQGDPDERPQREIHVDAFYIAKYLVTNRQYRKFVEQTGHREPRFWKEPGFGLDDYAVVGISWNDAQAYCRWAGLRLPTEAEWEKAASWDEEKKLKRWWPWGDTEPDPERANYASNIGHPTPVGQFPLGASPYGCLDMAGNAMEWCADAYLYNYYEISPDSNPPGPAKAPHRVTRGGSFARPSSYITVSNRYWYTPDYSDNETGLRCARSA